jgi:hypothetical protein
VNDDGVIADGLEFAFDRFFAVEHHADLLAGSELFEIVPGGILGAAERGTDKQGEERGHYSGARRAHPESPCLVEKSGSKVWFKNGPIIHPSSLFAGF